LLRRFLEQLEDPMIIVLIIAAFVSGGISIWEQNYTELFE
jgi:magnesium-transporting ATPase (P-type)